MFRDVPACSGMSQHVPECFMFRILSTPDSRGLLLHSSEVSAFKLLSIGIQ